MSNFILMGSGETTPTLIPTHREILAATRAAVGLDDLNATFVDTPFGFQMNAAELTSRTQTYFSDTVSLPVNAARWRRDADPTARAQVLNLLQRAHWALSGPGSPSYALAQWADTEFPGALADVALRGGTVILGSAAAVTAGSHSIPVYEIYKAGATPHWLPGINILERLTGITAAVIPHFDNAEGGNHDTRFCYLGETRLARLETELPTEVGVLGIDEQTVLWCDLAAGTARVLGRGTVTTRFRGSSTVFPVGTSVPINQLAALLRGTNVAEPASAPIRPADPESTAPTVRSILEVAHVAQTNFDAAVKERDMPAAVGVIVDLEQSIADWSHDTLVSDDHASARRVLRSLVVRLGEVAEVGARDPREVVAPFVATLLALRDQARTDRDFALADRIRTALTETAVEVRDTPEGVDWILT